MTRPTAEEVKGSVLAIDPGTNQGWSEWSDGVFSCCGIDDEVFQSCPVSAVVIEMPDRVEPGIPLKSVLNLTLKVGRLQERYKHLSVYTPTPVQWKGTATKAQTEAMLWHRLSTDERETLRRCLAGIAPSKRHNVFDAVGIGLWAVGRK